MSDINDLIIKYLDKLDTKIEKLDSKMDEMNKVHERNTMVLEEHERRSTASESRISILEETEQQRAERLTKIKGFLYYTGAIIGALGAIVYFLLNLTDLLKNIGH